MRRHIFQAGETTVVDLLEPTKLVEANDFDEERIEKIGDGRVVERQVAVFADPRADDVGRFETQRSFILQANL